MDKELKDLLEEQNKAFDEFKKSNDELLKAKAEGKAVSELEAKLGSAEAEISRLSKELDEVAKKANRPGAAGNDEKVHIEAEHKAGWLKWIRKGDDAGLYRFPQPFYGLRQPHNGSGPGRGGQF